MGGFFKHIGFGTLKKAYSARSTLFLLPWKLYHFDLSAVSHPSRSEMSL